MMMAGKGSGSLLLWILPTAGFLLFVCVTGMEPLCANCVRGICTRSRMGIFVCAEGCVDGFWGTSCRIPCDEHCLECQRSNGSCAKCTNDLFGENCDVTCENICLGFRCFNNGTCSDSICNDGWFGESCECNTRYSYSVQSGDTGKVCSPNKWGKCCNKTCSSKCRNDRSQRLCNLTTGHCISGCKDGWFGRTCNTTGNFIEGGCKHMSTSRVDEEVQSTTSSCLPNEWGESCNNTCPHGCKKIGTSRGCDVKSGVCIDGCMIGKYGPTCAMTCPGNCANGTCNITDGTCACIDGLCGDVCQLPCGTTVKPEGHVSMMSSRIINIAVSSLFVLVIGLICFQCRHGIKKHFMKREHTRTNGNLHEEENAQQEVHLYQGHRYWDIDDSELDNNCLQGQQIVSDGIQFDNNINIQRNAPEDTHDGYTDFISLPVDDEPTNGLSDSIVCDSDGVLHFNDRSGTISVNYITPQPAV